jgi:hypothetical protein
MHKPPQLTVSAIVCAVKNARRYHGYEYAKSVTAAACSSTQIDELDDEEECHSRADKENISAFESGMLELNKAILEYNPSNGSNQQTRNRALFILYLLFRDVIAFVLQSQDSLNVHRNVLEE